MGLLGGLLSRKVPVVVGSGGEVGRGQMRPSTTYSGDGPFKPRF
jgi:hypothetical protein